MLKNLYTRISVISWPKGKVCIISVICIFIKMDAPKSTSIALFSGHRRPIETRPSFNVCSLDTT